MTSRHENGAGATPTCGRRRRRWRRTALIERALFDDRQVIELERLCSVDTRQALRDFRQCRHNTKIIGSAPNKIRPILSIDVIQFYLTRSQILA